LPYILRGIFPAAEGKEVKNAVLISLALIFEIEAKFTILLSFVFVTCSDTEKVQPVKKVAII